METNTQNEVVIFRGLPGSGKSTKAKEFVANSSNPGMVRVNKDSIRSMLALKHNKKAETLVEQVRDNTILAALRAGNSVIVDDTNIALRHIAHIQQLVYGLANVRIMDFFDVPVEKCIEQDLQRGRAGGCVGKDVVLRMYHQYWEQQVRPPNTGVGEAIMCDLDGTLALFGNANPYDRDFSKDLANDAVVAVLEAMAAAGNVDIILMSGRDERFRDQTVAWLDANDVQYDYLYMRPEGDKRKDNIVKRELYMKYVQGNFRVLFVIDDRPQVVRMWRSELGLVVFDVGNGIEF